MEFHTDSKLPLVSVPRGKPSFFLPFYSHSLASDAIFFNTMIVAYFASLFHPESPACRFGNCRNPDSQRSIFMEVR